MKNDLSFLFFFYNPYIVVSCLKRVLFDMLITSHIIVFFFLKIEITDTLLDSWDFRCMYQTVQTKMTGHYVLRTPDIPETQYRIQQT